MIFNLIEEKDIHTQDELLNILKDMNFDITQATVSRDIKELGLVKILGDDGLYKYKNYSNELCRLNNFLLNGIRSVDFGGNIVIIKCFEGMAQGICAFIDKEYNDEFLGTIAGDDTIFILFKIEDEAIVFCEKLKNDYI